MRKSQTQQDLDTGIVSSRQDAERVAEALRLWPHVLMQDRRVVEAYSMWRIRHSSDLDDAVRSMHALTENWPPANDLLLRRGVPLLVADMHLLKTLVASLGLTDQNWLPRTLWFEFARTAVTPDVPLDISLPDSGAWWEAGRAPKQGATHHEDLERNLTWLYRATVKSPPDSKSRLETEYLETKARSGVHISKARNTVKNGIRRAQQLLNCVRHG